MCDWDWGPGHGLHPSLLPIPAFHEEGGGYGLSLQLMRACLPSLLSIKWAAPED